ncbi:MAG: hypothetical protein ACTHJ7_05030 [Candidatus Nitrosocosmicus sp.]
MKSSTPRVSEVFRCAIAPEIGFNCIIKEKLNFFTEALQIQLDR